MRDPKRIQRIMPYIEEIWERYPDMRFFQLTSMLAYEYSKANNGVGKRELVEKETLSSGVVIENPHPVVDLFHVEDEALEAFLIAFKNRE